MPASMRIPVALWSKFPTSFVTQKVIPGLARYGVDVIRCLGTETRNTDLSEVRAILIMNEMASHAEVARIKNLATSYGKKLISISRKQSSWPEILNCLHRDQDMPSSDRK